MWIIQAVWAKLIDAHVQDNQRNSGDGGFAGASERVMIARLATDCLSVIEHSRDNGTACTIVDLDYAFLTCQRRVTMITVRAWSSCMSVPVDPRI